MNTPFKALSWLLTWSAAAGIAAGSIAPAGSALAQESPPASPPPVASPAAAAAPATPAPGAAVKTPPKSTAQMDAGEPRANTAPAATGSPAAATPAAGTPAAGSPATGTPTTDTPATPPRAAATSRTSPKPGQKAPGTDRLQLGTATVTGEREQPKVMYIVPWKKSDIGDLSGKPMNSLLDEALAPVDRDEFKREVTYYDAVKADPSQNGASHAAAKQGEK
jgi:hypothetical protein